MDTKSKDFIRLDRRLIRVLGINNAIIFCHLQGVEQKINNTRGNDDAVYQQIDRLIFDTGLSKATIIKGIKELENLRLIHKIKHTAGNKNVYKIDNDYLELLLDQYESLDTTTIKKSDKTRKDLKRVVLNLYQEYYKNDTMSSTKFNTTNKDLIKKELNKKNNSKTSFTKKDADNVFLKRGNIIQDAYLKMYGNKLKDDYKEYLKSSNGKVYEIVARFIKEDFTTEDILNIFNNDNMHRYTLDFIQEFLQDYHIKFKKYHTQVDLDKFKDIANDINNILCNIEYEYGSIDILQDVIYDFINTTKKRNPTIFLFTSKDEFNNYNWIDTILKRYI